MILWFLRWSEVLWKFLKIGWFFGQMPRYWLRVNGWLFQNVSNYIPNNSGWSQVTPEHFKSVLVKKTKSPGPFVVIIFILKTAPILVKMPPYGLRVNGWTLNMVSKSIEVVLQMVLGNSWAICKCLSPKIKNPSPVGDIKLFSQIWSKSPKSKSAGGQWENLSDMSKNCYI